MRLFFLIIFSFALTILSAQEMKKKRGTVRMRYPNGKMMAKGKVRNHKKVGVWKFYDEQGGLRSTATYVNDSAHGVYREFSETGKLTALGYYCMNTKCGAWKRYDDSGHIISDENYMNDQFHGIQRFYYGNGVLRDSMVFTQGQMEYWKSWYPDGHPKGIETYRNGQPHGKWIRYPDPTLTKDTFPNMTIEYKDGQRHGYYRTFTGSQMVEEFYYVEGRSEGIQKRWDVSGKPVMLEWYTHSKPDSGYYYVSGIVARTVHFQNELKHGPEVDFDRSGDTLKLTWWRNGLTDSSFTYHNNGRRSSSLFYGETVDHFQRALYTEWDTSGRLLQRGWYINDQRDGEWTTYYPDGRRRSVTNYSNGRIVGLYSKWYPDGKKLLEIDFGNGTSDQSVSRAWDNKGRALKAGTPQFIEIIEGNKPGEIFSDASQYNRPIIEHTIGELRFEEEEIQLPPPDMREERNVINPPPPDRDEFIITPEKEAAISSDTNEVFSFCEVMPEFPGGEDGRKKYIEQNLHYPPDVDTEGTVYVEYIVEKDGSVSNVRLVKSIPGAPKLNIEALRVVTTFPKHAPGKMNGRAVRCRLVVPVRFTLR